MAEPNDTQEKGDEAPREHRPARPVRAAGNPPSEQAFVVSDLIRRGSDFLGQPSYVVAGALHGIDPESELTLDDARGRVEAWLEQPVAKEA